MTEHVLHYVIAHAAWAPERRRAKDRMIGVLREAPTFVTVLRSRRREPAAVWARRAWELAEDEVPTLGPAHTVILNDDLVLPPDFDAIVRAMVEAVPLEILSLHTTAPAARSHRGKTPWVRSYHYTGPAVVLPPGAAASLMDFATALPWSYVSRVNEDELAAAWAWSRQRPFYSPIPCVIGHDTTVPSTLGYDAHPERETCVPWVEDEPLTDVARWRVARPDDVPWVDCPWNPPQRLAALQQLLRWSAVCVVCHAREGIVGMRGRRGLVCRTCVATCAKMLDNEPNGASEEQRA